MDNIEVGSAIQQNNKQSVVIVGKGEAIFKKFLSNFKMWTGPNCKGPLQI